MRRQQNFQVNSLEYLGEAMTLYGTYSADSIEEIVDPIKHIHNLTKYEKMLAGKQPYWYKENIMERRITHMIPSSLLYLRELQMKYVNVYKDLIKKINIYIGAICILSTGYLPISLIPPSQLNDMITYVKKLVTKTDPEYYLVIKRLHLCYDMKLVTFGVDNNSDFIMQFLIFMQHYSKLPLTLYQIEVVPVPVIDQNIHTIINTEIQISKPYIYLNDEIYISHRH